MKISVEPYQSASNEANRSCSALISKEGIEFCKCYLHSAFIRLNTVNNMLRHDISNNVAF